MAIQTRRGIYDDFDPAKMLPGELATVTAGDPGANDGRSVYACFAAGDVKRMATYEDMQENINAVTAEIQSQLIAAVNQAVSEVETAITAAETATEQANQAKSDADEAADRANEAAARAEQTDVAQLVARIEELETAVSKCIGTP